MGDFNLMFDVNTQTIKCTFTENLDTLNSMTATEEFEKKMKEIRDSIAAGQQSATNSSKFGNISVIFDLNNVYYISSTFLRLCMSSARDIKKGNFSIINTDPEIMKVFKIAGLDGILNVS